MSAFTNPRTFKFVAVAATATPLIGTTLTQNVLGQPGVAQNVSVADSSFFLAQDFVNIVPATGSTSIFEGNVPITAVPDSTHITIVCNANHNSGDFVQLFWPCAQIMLQESKGTPAAGSIFVGPTQAVTNAGVAAFIDLSLVFTWVSPIRVDNSDNPANYWVAGSNAGDLYLPSLWRVF